MGCNPFITPDIRDTLNYSDRKDCFEGTPGTQDQTLSGGTGVKYYGIIHTSHIYETL